PPPNGVPNRSSRRGRRGRVKRYRAPECDNVGSPGPAGRRYECGRPSWGDHVASVAECEQAFQALAERLASADSGTRSTASFDRSLSCALPDLGVIFGGHLKDGTLRDIRQVESKDAQVR